MPRKPRPASSICRNAIKLIKSFKILWKKIRKPWMRNIEKNNFVKRLWSSPSLKKKRRSNKSNSSPTFLIWIFIFVFLYWIINFLEKTENARKTNATSPLSAKKRPWPPKSKKRRRPRMLKKTRSSNNCSKKTNVVAEKKTNSPDSARNSTKPNSSKRSVKNNNKKKKTDNSSSSSFNKLRWMRKSSSAAKKRKNAKWNWYILNLGLQTAHDGAIPGLWEARTLEPAIKKTKGMGTQARSGTPMETTTRYLLTRKGQRIRDIYQTIRNWKKKRRNN